ARRGEPADNGAILVPPAAHPAHHFAVHHVQNRYNAHIGFRCSVFRESVHFITENRKPKTENRREEIMRSALLCIALSLTSAALAAGDTASDSGFFNGKDLDGWEGLTKYWSVKDGAIVGYTPEDPKHNTFLCSKKKYGDFELKFKVRLKDGIGNSGVQI